MSHTPGPWQAHYSATGKYMSSVSRDGYVGASADQIALVGASNVDEQNSNARLIAAAPELLLYLQRAVDLFETDVECSDPTTDAWDWLHSANAVITKATPTHQEKADG